MSREIEILKKYGATNIEGYTLINNYGYTFQLGGRRFDARFWANCYGVALDEWQIDSKWGLSEDALKLIKLIERELNEGE